jgi:unspecific monooxygenase
MRRCIGMAFAMYEMKIVLGTMLRHVRMRTTDRPAIRPVRRGVTIAPDGGTPITLDAKHGV